MSEVRPLHLAALTFAPCCSINPTISAEYSMVAQANTVLPFQSIPLMKISLSSDYLRNLRTNERCPSARGERAYLTISMLRQVLVGHPQTLSAQRFHYLSASSPR